MAARSVRMVLMVVLCAGAWLLTVSQADAGGMVPTAGRARYVAAAASSPHVVATTARPVTVAVTVAMPAKPAQENIDVDLRGPDGQVRRFAVEGGMAAIQYRNVRLRPGEALTIHWVPAK